MGLEWLPTFGAMYGFYDVLRVNVGISSPMDYSG